MPRAPRGYSDVRPTKRCSSSRSGGHFDPGGYFRQPVVEARIGRRIFGPDHVVGTSRELERHRDDVARRDLEGRRARDEASVWSSATGTRISTTRRAMKLRDSGSERGINKGVGLSPTL